MEFFAGLLIAGFIGFVAVRVYRSYKNKGESNPKGGVDGSKHK